MRTVTPPQMCPICVGSDLPRSRHQGGSGHVNLLMMKIPVVVALPLVLATTLS